MKHLLVKEWSKLSIVKPPFFITGDKFLKNISNAKTYYSYKSFIKSQSLSDKETIHLGLIPLPYSGNLKTARIFILLLNPGFKPLDYYAEYNDKDYRRALINNLKQKNLDPKYPLKSLNPRFLWTGGGSYWAQKFDKIIKVIIARKGWSYARTLSVISRHVAIIEYFPYHSGKYSLSGKEAEQLESIKLIRSYVHEVLKPKAKTGEILILVTRNAKYWGLKRSKNIKIYEGAESRAAHLGKYKKEILKYLGI